MRFSSLKAGSDSPWGRHFVSMNSPSTPERTLSSLAIVFAGSYIAIQLISNVASLKIGRVAGLAVDLGTFLYPLSFTLRDAVHRTLGKIGSRVVVFTAAGLTLAMSLYLCLCVRIPSDPSWGAEMDTAFSLIFSPVWRLVIASITAATLSELLDTEVFHLAAYGRRPMNPCAASVLSNLASIPLDNFVFAFGAFAFVLPWSAIWEIFFFNLIVKAVVSLAGIPLLALLPRKK